MTGTSDISPDAAGAALRAFNDVEVSHRLFELGWDGVQIWSLMRLRCFLRILTDIGVFSYQVASQPALPGVRPSLIDRNPLLGLGRSPVMVFRWGRGTRRGGARFDLYTDPLSPALKQAGAQLIDLSPDAVSGDLPLDDRTARAEPLTLTWGRVAGRIWKKPAGVPEEVARRLAEAESDFARLFPGRLSLVPDALAAKAEYDRQRRLWAPVFALRRPRLVIMGTQSYGFEGLIAAAKGVGATVAELQHGLVYDAHLAYHYPVPVRLDHVPDVFLTFGEWWRDRVNYPLGMQRRACGYRALEDALEKRSHRIPDRPRLAVLTGDQLFGDRVPPVLSDLRRANPDAEIAVRPHPTDPFPYARAIAEAGLRDAVVTDPRIESIHEFLAGCTAALGAASTAVAESTALGLPTVAFLAGMSTTMGPVVEAGDAIVCNDLAQLGNAVAAAPAPRPASPLFDRCGTAFESFLSEHA
ncbi:hypothetical protein [Alsobacter sp. R-9]